MKIARFIPQEPNTLGNLPQATIANLKSVELVIDMILPATRISQQIWFAKPARELESLYISLRRHNTMSSCRLNSIRLRLDHLHKSLGTHGIQSSIQQRHGHPAFTYEHQELSKAGDPRLGRPPRAERCEWGAGGVRETPSAWACVVGGT